MLQEETEKPIFSVFFQICFGIIAPIILKKSFQDLTYFNLKVLIAQCVTLENHKKNLLNVTARNREVHFQSYFF